MLMMIGWRIQKGKKPNTRMLLKLGLQPFKKSKGIRSCTYRTQLNPSATFTSLLLVEPFDHSIVHHKHNLLPQRLRQRLCK
jgi:hypothetical protein